MNIIIVGCGKVGKVLAEQLSGPDNSIKVVDIDAKRANDLADKHDVLAVVGNGATYAVLQQANVAECDLVIAVTGSDEQNLLCCLLAKKSGCKTIARVRNPEYNADIKYLREELGLTMTINPEYAAAEEIARVLRFPSALKIDTFARGKVELVKFRLPEDSPIIGMQVKDVMSKLRLDVLVCTIERGDSAFIPNGDFVFEGRDIISVVAEQKAMYTFFRKIGYKAKQVHDVIIAGGGSIARYLCGMLRNSGIAVKIIEKDPTRAEQLGEELPEVNVTLADAISQSILRDEGIEKAEGFVALTNIDEENILLSLFARSVSRGKIVTKINRIDFDEVIDELDLGTIVYPKNITSEQIIRYVRAAKRASSTNLETLYQIIKGKVEAALFIVKNDCALTGTPIMNLDLKDGVLIAAIIREEKAVIPRGSDVIRKGDSVVLVTTQLGLHDMMDILR